MKRQITKICKQGIVARYDLHIDMVWYMSISLEDSSL